MNEKFGTDFTHGDKLIEEMERHLNESAEIKQAAEINTYDNYRYSFTPKLKDFIIENIEVKDDYIKLLEQPEALAFIDDYLSMKIYNEHRNRDL